jgi:hypothetical protein
MPLYGLEHLEMLWEPLHDTKCLIAWNSSTILLTFRGTASLKNALADAQVRQRDSPGTGARVQMSQQAVDTKEI